MAEQKVEVQVEAKGFENLKTQLREATKLYNELSAAQNVDPAVLQAAAKRVGELKDKLGDAKDSALALGNAAGKFSAFTKGIASISGGFTALQGAIGLAGGNAKEFEKTIQKVQSAMALTQGLTALADLGDAFGNMKTVAIDAFKGIKTAIGSTGIGLLVVALGAIYAYWDDIKALVSGVSEEQKTLNAEAEANVKAQQEALDALNLQENSLKLAGKSEEEILQLKIKATDEVIAATKIQLEQQEATKKAQIEAAQRNKDILQGILMFISAPITALLTAIDEVGKAFGKDFGLREGFFGGIAKMVFDPKEVETEADKTIKATKDNLAKLESTRDGYKVQAREKDKAAAAKRIEDQKKELDELKKGREDALKETKTAQQNEIDAVNEKYDHLIALAKKHKQKTTDLEAAKAAALKKIADKADADALAKQKETDQKKLDLAKETAKAIAVTQKQQRDLELQELKDHYDDLIKKNEGNRQAILDLLWAKGEAERELKKKWLEEDTKDTEKVMTLEEIKKKQYEDTLQSLDSLSGAFGQLSQAMGENTDVGYAALKIQEALNLATQIATFVTNLKALATGQEADASNRAALAKTNETIATTGNTASTISNTIAGAGNAVVKTVEGGANATAGAAKLPFPASLIAVAAVIGSFIGIVATIRNLLRKRGDAEKEVKGTAGGGDNSVQSPIPSKFANGGYLYGRKHAEGGIMTPFGQLEGGEYVVNRSSTAAFLPLLDQINSTGSGSGSPNNMSANAEKRNMSQPIIKTYVVASEMTSQQEANKRISDLARL